MTQEKEGQTLTQEQCYGMKKSIANSKAKGNKSVVEGHCHHARRKSAACSTVNEGQTIMLEHSRRTKRKSAADLMQQEGVIAMIEQCNDVKLKSAATLLNEVGAEAMYEQCKRVKATDNDGRMALPMLSDSAEMQEKHNVVVLKRKSIESRTPYVSRRRSSELKLGGGETATISSKNSHGGHEKGTFPKRSQNGYTPGNDILDSLSPYRDLSGQGSVDVQTLLKCIKGSGQRRGWRRGRVRSIENLNNVKEVALPVSTLPGVREHLIHVKEDPMRAGRRRYRRNSRDHSNNVQEIA